MIWTVENFSAVLGRLTPLTRKEALAIANALVAQGFQEKLALAIATSQANQWCRKNATVSAKSAHQRSPRRGHSSQTRLCLLGRVQLQR
ncbi:hypothetical protein [Lacticaseibacillus suibinensis]|uniref:hypothetical protein n=1 Tax=Lacticaseibacillus suibinensis TaxID=2486011 RepID=UPI0013DE0797|nr:hypothetical protein [Lacticaseibacillus suibinensis]